MINHDWPFGHLPKDKASEGAIYIAETNMATYSEDPHVLRELKRYLLLRRTLKRRVTMQSKRVDDAWHKFILDTRNYHAFCERVFGEYLHHESAHFALDEGFPSAYAELFGEELPSIWFEPEEVPATAWHNDTYYDSGNCA